MKREIRQIILVVVLLTTILLVGDSDRHAQSQSTVTLWSKQFGTGGSNVACGIAADNQGNVFVAGGTDGNLFGTNPGPAPGFAGSDDGFLAKYDSGGNLIWGKQFGTDQADGPGAIAIDSAGNVYVAGDTAGSLFATHVGGQDTSNCFIAKYDANGNQAWGKQFGTSNGDSIASIAVDSQNNVYAVGTTSGNLFGTNAATDLTAPGTADAFLVKYDSNGNQIWAKQFGAPGDDSAESVAIDNQGNIYVAGYTVSLFSTGLSGTDAFVAKFNSGGALLWGKQFGTSKDDAAGSICVNSLGDVYVGGDVNGGAVEDPNNPANDQNDPDVALDGFVSKFDSSGNQLWIKLLVTTDKDGVSSVVADNLGNVYLAGDTKGSLLSPNTGGEDILLAKYDTNGNIIWGYQYGTGSDDGGNSLCADNQGNLYLVGDTQGNLFGPNSGGSDIFIQKFSPNGQMARTKPLHTAPYKPLLFAWSGQKITFNYPPVLANKQPYVYAGYLCSGIPGAKVRQMATKQVVIEGPSKQVIISPNSLTYQINGKAHKMSAKPVLVSNNCYVPLDVMKAVLPYPVRYEAKTQTVRFDPPQPKQARK